MDFNSMKKTIEQQAKSRRKLRPKLPTSYKFSERTKELIERIADKNDDTKTATLERLVKEEAERKGISL